MTAISALRKYFGRGPLLTLASAVGAMFIAYSEYDFATLPFAAAVFAVLIFLLLILSGRIVFSTLTAWAILAVITAISATKMKFMGMALHAFDPYFYFYSPDFEVAALLSQNYLLPIMLCAGVMVTAIAVCFAACRYEPVRNHYRKAACVCLIPALAAWNVFEPQGGDKSNEHRYYTSGHRTSSFFYSLKDARYLFIDPPLVERLAAMSTNAAYDGVADCAQPGARPDVIVVLMESAIRPSLFPQIKAPAELKASFKANGRTTHGLRVETWGGGTWITTTGLMTSLPTAEFGWMRPYLPVYLQDRVQHSLPKLLKSCGYQTAVISPLSYPFLNEGPFLTSLGIEDYRDFNAIKAKSRQVRDKFYFDAALDYIKRHHEHDTRPLFLYLMTMAAHGPYTFRFEPEIKLAGEPFGNDPEMDEYLRRLTMQQTDLAAFTDALTKLPARDGTLVVDFGDHQPSVTRDLAEQAAGADALAHWDSIGYRTYFSITPVHMKLKRALPDLPSLDIAYLAPTVLEVAGLPVDDVYKDLIALRDRCGGAFMLCPEHRQVERYLKKLANGGLLKFDTPQKATAAVVLPIPGQPSGVAAIVGRLPAKN